jgi:hypothetical protein
MITLSPAPASLPEGRRIYAIGDIHGCDVQLGNLHAVIAEDLARRPVDAPLLLHIGDYVDRGADTAGVLRRRLARSPIEGVPVVNLSATDDTMLRASRAIAPQRRTGCSPAAGRRCKATASIRIRRARAGRRTCPASTWISCATSR